MLRLHACQTNPKAAHLLCINFIGKGDFFTFSFVARVEDIKQDSQAGNLAEAQPTINCKGVALLIETDS